MLGFEKNKRHISIIGAFILLFVLLIVIIIFFQKNKPQSVQFDSSLENNYSSTLEPIKSISDEIVYHPAKYKVLFGSQAPLLLQATFKAVQSPSSTASITSLQTRILSAINDFFLIDNWDFGQTFNFGELVTYVMNIMTPDITNFVIVPKSSNSNFGSLFQISCQSNEIFISGATVSDIQIINSLTASELNSTSVVTSS